MSALYVIYADGTATGGVAVREIVPSPLLANVVSVQLVHVSVSSGSLPGVTTVCVNSRVLAGHAFHPPYYNLYHGATVGVAGVDGAALTTDVTNNPTIGFRTPTSISVFDVYLTDQAMNILQLAPAEEMTVIFKFNYAP